MQNGSTESSKWIAEITGKWNHILLVDLSPIQPLFITPQTQAFPATPSQRKRSERLKHCALAVVRQSQTFSPAADPFPGAQDGQDLISWRWSLIWQTYFTIIIIIKFILGSSAHITQCIHKNRHSHHRALLLQLNRLPNVQIYNVEF